MTRVRIGLALVAAFLSSACLVSSLHPVYDDNSLVFDETLIGTWEIRESQITVTVERGEWRSYHVAYTDRFGTTRFTAHLTTVAAARFLNVRPEDGLERAAFILATNGFMQIDITRDTVRVREPDYAVAFKRVEAGKLGIAAATDLKQNVLLTAPSSKVRAWLAGALKDATLWADWKTFTRSPR